MATVMVDINDNCKRAAAGVLLAMHVVSRPSSKAKPLICTDLPLKSELMAEAGLEEEKMILGWLLNTQSLLIS